ncbi:MAG: trypsin-like peptidase domain-containing protein [Woeseiaceae bacterium]
MRQLRIIAPPPRHLSRAIVTLFALSFGSTALAQIGAADVVRVTVTDSTNTGQSATGFLWESDRQVVTSLHAVLHKRLPGRTIKVFCGGVPTVAQVSKVYQAADLVLLTTESPVRGCKVFTDSFRGMSSASLKPDPDTLLYTFGWRGAASSSIKRELKKEEVGGDETLEGLIPNEKTKDILRALRLPEMSLDIYLVDGDGLGGGFSGGPVVNASGKLLGIVDGGLDNGGSDYNWMIPATRLNDLKDSSSRELPRVDLTLLENHFSAGLVVSSGVQSEIDFATNPNSARPMPPSDLSAGGEPPRVGSRYHFVLTKTRTLDSIIRSADAKIGGGINRLLSTYRNAVGDDVRHRLSFDIFEDDERGLIIAVPHGQGLIDGPLVSRPDIYQLRSDAPLSGGGDIQYQEIVPDSEGYIIVATANDGKHYYPEDAGYFDAYKEEIIRHCESGGDQRCGLDPIHRYVGTFPNGNKVMGFGMYIHPTEGEYRYVENHSVAVRGNVAFTAVARAPYHMRRDDLVNCVRLSMNCADSPMALSQMSNLLAAQLITFRSSPRPMPISNFSAQ